MMLRATIAFILLMGLANAAAGEPTAGPTGPTGPVGPAARIRTEGIDPSENVKALNEAGLKAMAEKLLDAIKRQDDLRGLSDKLAAADIKRIDEVSSIRQFYENKISDLIRNFGKETFEAESKRIDANRATDAAATEKASTLALNSIKDLTAVALTAQISATYKSDTSNDKRFEQLKSELGILIKGLDEKIVLLTTQNNIASGKDAGSTALWAAIAVGVGLLIGVAGLMSGRLRVGSPQQQQPYYPYPYPYSYPYPQQPPQQPPPGRRRATDQAGT
jgi:hypothetical protein